MVTIPRPEYPRPLLQRLDWLNLNGEWRFGTDPKNVGLVQKWYQHHDYEATIQVPFTMNASASGASHLTPCDIVWYAREFELPTHWHEPQLLIHLGACDHRTQVYVNGELAGAHTGGYAPFHFDIKHLVKPGTNTVTLRVTDSLTWTQPRGKQAGTTRWPIDYDPIIGPWQTIWLEPVNTLHASSLWTTYSIADKLLKVNVKLSGLACGSLQLVLLHDGVSVASLESDFIDRPEVRLELKVEQPALWSPATPTLYELQLMLKDSEGNIIDRCDSYAGLRQISVKDRTMYLNDSPLYLRGILDQGYFPEGWYTAVDDLDLKRDVELTLAMGFNCARKHQKAEDPRYLYWADRLGLLVWAEMPSGRIFSTELIETLSTEWTQLVQRDRGHPSVITWVPFNESWGVWHQAKRPEQQAFVDAITSLTQALDPSRPVVGNDGWEFSSGDLWTLHLYETATESIAERLAELLRDPSSEVGGGRVGALPGRDVSKLPVLLTECGGIGFTQAADEDHFAYGDLPLDKAALKQRFQAIASEIHHADSLSGFVWTQLTDVQQEINGVLFFDRTPKLAIDDIKTIMMGIGPNS